MKNKLVDLNNHLFAQLERLGDEDLSQDEVQKEISRTKAVVDVSKQIIDNARVGLTAAKLVAEYGGEYESLLPMAERKDAKQIEPPKIPKYEQ